MQKSAKRKVIRYTAGATVLIVAVLVVIVYLLPIESGDPMIRRDHREEDIREGLKVTLDSYEMLVEVFTGAFGVLAFLLTYRHDVKARISETAWAQVAASLVFLTAGIVFTLIGREIILGMVANDAVQLASPALRFARFASYGCLTGAAALVGLFALEVTQAEGQ